jgi:N-methylhydantoinase B
MTKVDPITVEVVRNAFLSTIQEMRATIPWAAFSPNIYESTDFSCALVNPRAEILALSDDLPAHIFSIGLGVQAIQEKFAIEAIHPGDVFIMNDPYVLGSHMNDIATLYPYFIADELVMWVSLRFHTVDVGGMFPGSVSVLATDVHQEGVRIPPIKIQHEGKPNQSALDMLFANVRNSIDLEGDLLAFAGAAEIAGTRLDELHEKYGRATVDRCVEVILNRGEQRMREAILRLRPGEYYHEHYMESPSDGAPLLIRTRLTVKGDEIVVDFSGSAPQTSGPINGGRGSAPCGAFTALKAALDPHSPVNAGALRPINVIVEEGSMLLVKYPVACGGAMHVINGTTEAVMKTLASAHPDGVSADAICVYAGHVFSGWDDMRQRPFIFQTSSLGGTGGVAQHDGNNVVAGYERSDFSRIFPAEAMETTFPMRVERTELIVDSGGPGRRRGGLGLRRDYRVLCETAALESNLEPSIYPTFGFFGGGSGGTVYQVAVVRGSQRLIPGPVDGKCAGFPLKRGDLVETLSTTGAGYGDPLEREPELVLQDVVNGYVSIEEARDAYGVVIGDGAVNAETTAVVRETLAGKRRYLPVKDEGDDHFKSGRRVGRVGRELAKSLGVTDGEIIEYVSNSAAALRAWVRVDSKVSADLILLGPLAKLALKVDAGEKVWVRALRRPHLLRPKNQSPDALRKRKEQKRRA